MQSTRNSAVFAIEMMRTFKSSSKWIHGLSEWAWVKSSFALSIRVLIAGNKNENHILYSPALRERKRGPQPTTDSFSYNNDDDDDGIFNSSGFLFYFIFFFFASLARPRVHSHFILFYYSFIVHIFCYVCSAHFSCIMKIPHKNIYKTHIYKLKFLMTICFIFIFLRLHFFRILFCVCVYSMCGCDLKPTMANQAAV